MGRERPFCSDLLVVGGDQENVRLDSTAAKLVTIAPAAVSRGTEEENPYDATPTPPPIPHSHDQLGNKTTGQTAVAESRDIGCRPVQ
ncbi:Uncharacterised protein [Mycobacterium tuberculosis]|uniref:Uncharacterized protein n=1 Tax=Mycobacterium tuberculosis TaxID=1773 RepID=A0A0T9FAW4_MYCTX|nr:Uncharacterised protein [Mycobacterium tuberculosis]CFE48380.1 Uncharacterised protein [Mycobacterium tuberculosis]CFR66399.1 Uncharacterised protein [Mycobacterium tuberculosis]CKT97022.1 Uncharacterised protein [Mycobacterium tuberculosis]CKU02976.1 Uncharacterised protein [Mycobacterium tuberculosis]